MSETLDQAPAATEAPSSEPAGDDLRSVIESAFRESADRDRDDRGRFAPSGERPDQTPPEAEAAAPAPEKEAPAVTRPETWDAAEWDSLSPTARDRVAQRERDMQAALEQRAGHTQEVEHYRQIIAPHERRISELGLTPPQAFERLLTWERAVRDDPAGALRQLAQSVGFDLRTLIQPDGQDHPQQTQFRDPRVDAMLASQEQAQRQTEAREMAQVQASIDAFAADSRNAHFPTVKVAMGHLMQAYPNLTLQEAYDRAVWADPALRTERIEADAKTRATAKAKADADAVAQARRTSRSVRDSVPTSGVNGHAIDPAKVSLRDELRMRVMGQG